MNVPNKHQTFTHTTEMGKTLPKVWRHLSITNVHFYTKS